MLRDFVGDDGVRNPGGFLEAMLNAGLLDVVSNDDERLGTAEACYVPSEKCIYIRDKDYRGVVEGTNPRSRFTFWHEFGHMWLGHDKKFSRDTSAKLSPHKVYEDSEWQANMFAAEVLMPIEKVKAISPQDPFSVSKEFGVSFEAAEVRLSNLRRYAEI